MEVPQGLILIMVFHILVIEFLDDIPWLKNAVSTRLGGVSKDYLASMNLGFTEGFR